jgi:hypothetical protein
MKTAISIPDDLFERAERLTRTVKKSRSQLYSQAIREYVARHAGDQVTESLDRLCVDGLPEDNPFAMAAARRTLRRVQW